MNSLLISAIVFCLGGVAAAAIYAALSGRSRALEERFSELALQLRVAHGMLASDELDSGNFARALFRWTARRLPPPKLDTPKGEKLAQTLVEAGFIRSSALHTFHVVRIMSAIGMAMLGLAGGLLVGLPGASVILYMICGAVAGAFIPSYCLGHRARSRQREIARQLSDALDLLIVCVEAGLGIFEAIKVVGQETERQKQAIGKELAMVSAEINSGQSLGQALRGLSERTAVEDIKPLAATLIQAEQLGTQMAPALRNISDTLRARRRMRAEEAAQKTTIKILFPLIFFVLPAMIIIVVGPAMLRIASVLGH